MNLHLHFRFLVILNSSVNFMIYCLVMTIFLDEPFQLILCNVWNICPGGFRVQRKAEGNSPHQLLKCRGPNMVWFFGKIVFLFISSFCCNSTFLLKSVFEGWFKFCWQEGPKLNQWSLPEGSITHSYFHFNVCNNLFLKLSAFSQASFENLEIIEVLFHTYFIHNTFIWSCLDYTLMDYSYLDYLWCKDYFGLTWTFGLSPFGLLWRLDYRRLDYFGLQGHLDYRRLDYYDKHKKEEVGKITSLCLFYFQRDFFP